MLEKNFEKIILLIKMWQLIFVSFKTAVTDNTYKKVINLPRNLTYFEQVIGIICF